MTKESLPLVASKRAMEKLVGSTVALESDSTMAVQPYQLTLKLLGLTVLSAVYSSSRVEVVEVDVSVNLLPLLPMSDVEGLDKINFALE